MVEVIDASGLIIGRLSTYVAKKLLKEKETEIAIVNAERAIVSGNRKMVIERYKKKRELNHPRKGPYFPRMPDRILKRTIRGMLPYQQPKGREALKRVKVYIGFPEELKGEKTESVDSARNKGLDQFVELAEISRILGAKL
ncbi:MAG: 50S ribosomal protein L13 [Thermoplasmata archaeon]|nr:MAG: 50S ribosomal protein L13 [Thermoplasmatales archaeon ex4484_6]RLF61538.1 MAG: 50S ribosomal protein L13 [Thermoplasmata archaeon]RLF69184.1 MAG: 50S ribosomal protein L13 [Thermoplasmata archaeon]HHD16355.1 50S ribosomal protein L13 [Euryarchaeota archaeon]